MREIKFRAWNRIRKLMTLPFSLIELSDKGSKRPFPLSNVMQYTGIKDKNGKEIYEGDIVEIKYPSYEISHKIIEWNNKFCCYKELYCCSNKLMKVVGNIHENPELINEGGNN